jgi:hypothetical protein
MIQLVYISSARTLFSKEDLTGLLAKSRANNEAHAITGLLLYKGGNFMQVLEGDEEAVRMLYERIGGDPRHTGVMVLLRNPIEQRQFSDWSMGFRDLNDPALRTLPGYSEFLNVPLDATLSPSRCQKLIEVFKTRM